MGKLDGHDRKNAWRPKIKLLLGWKKDRLVKKKPIHRKGNGNHPNHQYDD